MSEFIVLKYVNVIEVKNPISKTPNTKPKKDTDK